MAEQDYNYSFLLATMIRSSHSGQVGVTICNISLCQTHQQYHAMLVCQMFLIPAKYKHHKQKLRKPIR